MTISSASTGGCLYFYELFNQKKREEESDQVETLEKPAFLIEKTEK